jgi:hypothetical protein
MENGTRPRVQVLTAAVTNLNVTIFGLPEEIGRSSERVVISLSMAFNLSTTKLRIRGQLTVQQASLFIDLKDAGGETSE